MPEIVIAGMTRLVTTMPVDGFPLEYSAYRQPSSIRHAVGGGAYNVAGALLALGDVPRLCTLVGDDIEGDMIRAALRGHGLDGRGVVTVTESAKTVILLGPGGLAARSARANGAGFAYPTERFVERAVGADMAVITSHVFGLPLLRTAKELLNLPVATDLHTTARLDDAAREPWLEASDVLFCSHEELPCTPVEWIGDVLRRYPGCQIAAVGCGPEGCAMGLRDGRLVEIEAVTPRPVRGVDGAGDALFASFLHGWLVTGRPVEALESAVLFAGWKIGAASAADGFLTRAELAAMRQVYPLRTRLGWWR